MRAICIICISIVISAAINSFYTESYINKRLSEHLKCVDEYDNRYHSLKYSYEYQTYLNNDLQKQIDRLNKTVFDEPKDLNLDWFIKDE